MFCKLHIESKSSKRYIYYIEASIKTII